MDVGIRWNILLLVNGWQVRVAVNQWLSGAKKILDIRVFSCNIAEMRRFGPRREEASSDSHEVIALSSSLSLRGLDW